MALTGAVPQLSALLPGPAVPLLVLAAGAVAVLVVELAAPSGRGWPHRLALALAAACVAAAMAIAALAGGGSGAWAAGPESEGGRAALRLVGDGLTQTVYVLVGLAALGAMVLVAPHLDRGEPASFVALLLLAAAGMGLVAGAASLAVLFLGLELLSLSLYVLVAYRREDPRSQEGAFKYFLLGSLASGLLLFGIALIYGATGSLAVGPGSEASGPLGSRGESLAALGYTLALGGLAFKLALAPFHFWAPDAYEGGLLGVTAFMAVATKAAALAGLVRLGMAAPQAVRGVLGVLAGASMLVGSLGALRQQDFRRLMAYSGIANAGYLLAALPGFAQEGLRAATFYLAAYLFVTMGLFAVAGLVEGRLPPAVPGGVARASLRDLRALGLARPWAGWAAVLFLAGLTGLPLTGGFVGKVLLMRAAVAGGALPLALLLVVSTAVLAYPYWQVAQAIFRPTSGPGGQDTATSGWGPAGAGRLGAVVAVCAAATVLLGLFPQPWLAALAGLPAG